MNNYNNIRFNYNYYERSLSPFGNKVLRVLIQNFIKENEPNGNYPQPTIPTRKKRVLQFRDVNTNSNKPTTSLLVNSQNTSRNTFEGRETIKSSQLLKTIEVTDDVGIEDVSREDLVETIVTKQDSTDLPGFYNKKLPNKIIIGNLPQSKDEVEELNTVPWDDIFDTELLVTDENVANQSILQNVDTPFLFDLSDANGSEITSDKNISNFAELVKKQHTKQKIQKKETDTFTKKPKIVKSTNKLLRKQKYTKAVKNWLNDVSPNNPIEEGVSTKVPEVPNPQAKKICVEKSNKAQNKKPKKVVQAQLANKDGVMKFTKPKSDNIESEKDKDKENQESVIEKKSKAKFVAPIKSQIAVKDITYQVHTVKDNDFRKYYLELNSNVDKEYVAILVYSNNFNQLNCHHTEDSSDVDGVMINIENDFYFFKGVFKEFSEILAKIFENKLVCYEGKDIINYLASKLNVDISPARIVDVKIGTSLLDPDNPPDNFSEVQKLLSFIPQFTIATECPLQKAAWYITLLKECVSIMSDMLIQQSLWNVFVNIEMRLLPVVAAMERRGVSVDLEKLKAMETILLTKMKSVEQRCYQAAGRSFQINSPLQISAILYDELQLDRKCNVKIRETLCKGAKSTSETMLRSLVSVHPLPRLILEYRHLHKAHATFLAGIAHHVRGGVVTPTWVQTAAVTGRIASNNPNLQAIPKAPFNLVMFSENNDEDAPSLRFRSVYTSRPGYTLVAADFKHVECRVFAHVAADTSLLDALRTEQDLFKVLAAKWLQKPEIEVSSEDRERTKRIIYASLYGAGTRKLMDILNVSYDQTLTIVSSFNRTFPSLKSFGRSVVSRCEQNGGRLSTICGRARQFKHISSDDFALRSQAERQAVNFIVQGSAADLCKMAMVETHEQLRSCDPPAQAHLVLQIHDELVWEVWDEHLHEAIAIIKRVMENCGHLCGMNMHLPVEVHTGKNWGEMDEYNSR